LPLIRARSVTDLWAVEGRVALRYWQAYASVIPECFDFHGRMTSSHQNNASDPVNLALNYAYGVLEGECRAAINTVGLEPSVGFLHETSVYQTKQSLVYDLQEPFRWLVDHAVLRMVLSRTLSWDDFYLTGGDYRLRIKPPMLDRYAELLRQQFNSGVVYSGKRVTWDTLILRKCQELARHLLNRTAKFDLRTPKPVLERRNTRALREKILGLSSSDARRLRLGKSTVHYLRKRAKEERPFKVYTPVLARL
jgi:CRISPR-associated protein Cas1